MLVRVRRVRSVLSFQRGGVGGCRRRRRRRRMGADVKKGKKGEVLPRSTA